MMSTGAAALLAAVVLLSGCGGDASGEVAKGGASVASNSAGGIDRCKLLTRAEVADVIGPHDGGKSGEGEWGTMSCRWTADKVQHVEGYPPWHDAVEVAVFDGGMILEWARSEARGDPVAGFVDGALYDVTWGNLWFPCAAGWVCVVKIHTVSGDRREEFATRLARLVNGRV